MFIDNRQWIYCWTKNNVDIQCMSMDYEKKKLYLWLDELGIPSITAEQINTFVIEAVSGNDSAIYMYWEAYIRGHYLEWNMFAEQCTLHPVWYVLLVFRMGGTDAVAGKGKWYYSNIAAKYNELNWTEIYKKILYTIFYWPKIIHESWPDVYS